MATIEFVQERVNKAKENISKKEALIIKMTERIEKNISKLHKMGFTDERIEKAIENPYRIERDENYEKAFDIAYSIRGAQESIKSAHEALEELQPKLAGYEADLQSLIEKANSRDIKVILDFLEMWKEQVKRFYQSKVDEWVATLLKYYEEDGKYCDWFNRKRIIEKADAETIKKMKMPREKARAEHAVFNFLDAYMDKQNGRYILNLERLQKDLDNEANAKYDFIIERTNKIVGQITDASNLEIGNKGDLNGYIIGTRGTAKVQTIGAGGYNIQCYHFRTLIHEMK